MHIDGKIVRPQAAKNRLSRPQNRILSHLSPDAFAQLRPRLRRVKLKRREILQEHNRRVTRVLFIETGVAVILAHTLRDGHVGVGVVGRLGMVGIPVLLGTMRSPHRCLMEVQGEALQINAEDLVWAMNENPEIRQHLMNYLQALLIQNSQTILCNARHAIEERLARLLLLARDRLDDDLIPATHDLFSMMLGVRRAGITAALASLEKSGAVRRHRGAVGIVDRAVLEAKTCECYKIIANEYGRLIDTE